MRCVLQHLAGRAFSSDWFLNSFTMNVYENILVVLWKDNSDWTWKIFSLTTIIKLFTDHLELSGLPSDVCQEPLPSDNQIVSFHATTLVYNNKTYSLIVKMHLLLKFHCYWNKYIQSLVTSFCNEVSGLNNHSTLYIKQFLLCIVINTFQVVELIFWQTLSQYLH